MITRNLSYLIFFFFGLAGCVTAPSIAPEKPPVPGMPGIYHRVEKGQTLWSISRAYQVEIEELTSINRIQDAASIEVGQSIFVPHRQKKIPLPASYVDEDFIWPLRGKIIAPFGATCANMINKGINIKPYGSSEVIASRKGRVVFRADNFGVFGKTIIIDHGGGLATVYAGNSSIFVNAGDQVEKGAAIGKIESSGQRESGYLHFEIRKSHLAQNPSFYLSN